MKMSTIIGRQGSPGSSSNHCIADCILDTTPKCCNFSDSGYISTTPSTDSPSCSSKEYEDTEKNASDKLVKSNLVNSTLTPVVCPTVVNKKPWRLHKRDLIPAEEKIRKFHEEISSIHILADPYISDESARNRQSWAEKTEEKVIALGDAILLKQNVDFIKELACRRTIHHVVSKIFQHLSPKELCVVACVSRVWREVCLRDTVANQRRLKFLEEAEQRKENRMIQTEKKVWNKEKKSPGFILGQISQNTRAVDDSTATHCREVLRWDELGTPQNRSRFDEFIKEAACLENGGELRHCPQCYSPSHVNKIKRVASCRSRSCLFMFCILCQQPYHHLHSCHTLEDCTSLKKSPRIGSKCSKKNLKRM